jgi:hypothetical protein
MYNICGPIVLAKIFLHRPLPGLPPCLLSEEGYHPNRSHRPDRSGRVTPTYEPAGVQFTLTAFTVPLNFSAPAMQ